MINLSYLCQCEKKKMKIGAAYYVKVVDARLTLFSEVIGLFICLLCDQDERAFTKAQTTV